MNKRTSAILFLIVCALMTQTTLHAQDNPVSWDSDPLDVLEAETSEATSEPAAPEFQDIPAAGDTATAPTDSDLSESALSESTQTDPEPTESAQQDSTTPAAPVDDIPEPEIMQSESFPAKPLVAPEEPFVPPQETAVSLPSEPSVDQVQPDYNKEADFHRIYKTYNEQPTSVEAWEAAISSRESQNYQILKGDTLSDISRTFFNDPFYWPKIWSLNSQKIGNPHEISPGQNIQFFPGSLLDAPTLAVVAENTAAGEGADSVVRTSPPSLAGVTIPPGKRTTPLLKNLPASLPGYAVGSSAIERQDLIVDLKPPEFPKVDEDLQYYISEKKLEQVGVVNSIELGVNAAGTFQNIYVKLNEAPEKTYVVQAYRDPLRNPIRGAEPLQSVEVQGEIEILEKVNEQKNIYRALVKKALNPVRVGAFLTPGTLQKINLNISPLSNGLKANIIGGSYDKNRELLMVNSFIFLDRGASQGLENGQCIGIFANEDLRNNSDAKINERQIGVVKIVKVTPQFSTGYIVRADEDIRTGDFIGGRPTGQVGTVSVVKPIDRTFDDEIDALEAPLQDDTPASESGLSEEEFEL